MAGSISSGIGLISGLPTQDLIDQLISLESRPLRLLNTRVQTIQTQRTALSEISARLLGLKTTIARFDETGFFRTSKATSSNENVLTATTSENAAQGRFQFQVKSLVSNQQLISRGFADADRQSLGAGEISFEIGKGSITRSTPLDALNGGAGVRRGLIEIVDSDGNLATIDLTTALTVDDVLDEINNRVDLRVQARVEGDHLVIEDRGSGTSAMGIRDVGSGNAARDLGIAGIAAAGQSTITGSSIIRIADSTALSALNDGNGISVGKANQDIDLVIAGRTFTVGLRGLLDAGNPQQANTGTRFETLNRGQGVRQGTFKITNKAGQSAEIVVDDSVQTIGDVIAAINNAGIDVTATVGAVDGNLLIRDGSSPVGQDAALTIEDVTGGAATDLGIAGSSTEETLTGDVILRIATVGDVVRAINFAESIGADGTRVRNTSVQAAISDDGFGLVLTATDGSDFSVAIGAGAIESQAAADLGLVGQSSGGVLKSRRLLAGLNTVLLSSLRGGSGIQLGTARFEAGDGSSGTIDFSSASTVQDIVDLTNAQTDVTKISARLNASGTGIVFVDESGGTGTARLKDISGGTIGDLFGLDGTEGRTVTGFDDGQASTGNLQLKYVSNNTLLSELNAGRGIGTGQFRVTARNGQFVDVSITENQETVGDLLTRINSLLFEGLEARINDTGDGIEIVDTTTGEGTLSVAALDGATTARDLNLLGKAADFTDAEGVTRQRIDGSYEYRVTVGAGDTLDDLRNKINALGAGVRATIINSGGSANSFHLILSSEVSGTAGEVVIDGGGTDLSFDTLVRARDAVVLFGGADAQRPILLSSTSNTLSGMLPGVTLELNGVSDTPVDLNITRDIEQITTDIGAFVSGYNGVLDAIAEQTQFDAETETRGTLFGDPTVSLAQNRLRRTLQSAVAGADARFNQLFDVGIQIGSGGRLSFDEQKFRDAFNEDPQAVERLFTLDEAGFGDKLDKLLDDLTEGTTGLFTRRDNLLQDREELLNDRIETLQETLDRKRSRLERQFQGLESSLAGLQDAQNSLGSLASLLSA